ncbi:MAG: SHOCT domain-containing protein [bacterium]
MHGWEFMHWGWFGFIVQIIFWVAIILLIVWVAKKVTESGSGDRSSSAGESALDILKKRYAKGEIDKDEYEKKKKDLTA